MANPEGFTPDLKEACRDACAEYGDPPCWQLPDLVGPCDHITPCKDCLSAVADKERD